MIKGRIPRPLAAPNCAARSTDKHPRQRDRQRPDPGDHSHQREAQRLLPTHGTHHGRQDLHRPARLHHQSERIHTGDAGLHNGPWGLSGTSTAGVDTGFNREPQGTLNSTATGASSRATDDTVQTP
ncbi:hypothetical protein GCM10010394_54980 [Streptomyces crystallinus]|uniref:Uncharacterized protein n=1 Tax=Streptomyces crystallinus TaxID=68191 RepID=A0ABP3RZ09_9ACTN